MEQASVTQDQFDQLCDLEQTISKALDNLDTSALPAHSDMLERALEHLSSAASILQTLSTI